MFGNDDLAALICRKRSPDSVTKDAAKVDDRIKPDQFLEEARGHLSDLPLVLVIVGPSGAGKSSTIKALFNVDCGISHTVSCTKEFTPYKVDLLGKTPDGRSISVKLEVVDCPGLGESIELDDGYINDYLEQVSRADVMLWVSDATVRAISQEQLWLSALASRAAHHNKPIVFALNKIDLVTGYTPASIKFGFQEKEQEHNLAIIVRDRIQKFNKCSQSEGHSPLLVKHMIPYASARPETLPDLLKAIMQATPRGHMFHAISEDYTEHFMSRHAAIKRKRAASMDDRLRERKG